MDELNRRAAGTARGSEGHQIGYDGTELITRDGPKSIEAAALGARSAISSDLEWFREHPWRHFRLRPFTEDEERVLDQARGEQSGDWLLVRAYHQATPDGRGTPRELQWLRVGPLRREYIPGDDRTCGLLWHYYARVLGRCGFWYGGQGRAA